MTRPAIFRHAALLMMTMLFSAACTTSATPGAAPVLPVEQVLGPAQVDVAIRLDAMHALLDAAEKDARRATRARNMNDVRRAVDQVYTAIWGEPSGLLEGQRAAHSHGWKTRWQARYTDFDPAFAQRYGPSGPRVTNPQLLGIAGQGRALRRQIEQQFTPASAAPLLNALNNVIGWTRLDEGVTKAERQPRIDLTHRWDADQAFWLGEADTGWIFAVQAQALNILKTDYGSDRRRALTLARQHARDLQALIQRCRDGESSTETLASDSSSGTVVPGLADASKHVGKLATPAAGTDLPADLRGEA